MYNFTWTDMVTNDTVTALLRSARISGATAAEKRRVRVLVSRLLEATFGPPILNNSIEGSEATDLCDRILRGHLHAHEKAWTKAVVPIGCLRQNGHAKHFREIVTAENRIPVNVADARAVGRLPEIGPKIAKRILLERQARGPFSDAEDLENRLHGIGRAALRRLQAMLTYELSKKDAREVRSGGYGAAISRNLQKQPGRSRYERLISALTALAEGPHNWHSSLAEIPRPFDNAGASIICDADAETIGILAGKTYHKSVRDLIGEARARVWVCMFHIAYPGPKHPTGVLLQALVSAKKRGADVRVIMDRDRPTDPYLSSVINSDAMKFLVSAGVAARYDTAEKLLHSKYALIDDDLTIMGSHNWTAGSYFQQDDLSLAVRSRDLANQIAERFDALWSTSKSGPDPGTVNDDE